MSEAKPGLWLRTTEFIDEVRSELKKVTWPTKEQLRAETQVTLLLLGVLGMIIFLYDQVFQRVVLVLLNLGS